LDQQQLKVEAAREALASVRSGMNLGLGSGTTANEFVKLLADEVKSGRLGFIRCTSTSARTEELATSLGIQVFSLAQVSPIDLAIDGADEIDKDLRLIKGRGGALLREKIVEQQAKRFIVIADETKLVDKLGAGVLPVEVTPFAMDVLMIRFQEMGLDPVLRLRDGRPRITDEHHTIIDIRIPEDLDIAEVVVSLREHAGVVETGFFPREATEAIIATSAGLKKMKR
jgi:ribose 5-phosphate isomerase A